jgi:hypothetical protein
MYKIEFYTSICGILQKGSLDGVRPDEIIIHQLSKDTFTQGLNLFMMQIVSMTNPNSVGISDNTVKRATKMKEARVITSSSEMDIFYTSSQVKQHIDFVLITTVIISYRTIQTPFNDLIDNFNYYIHGQPLPQPIMQALPQAPPAASAASMMKMLMSSSAAASASQQPQYPPLPPDRGPYHHHPHPHPHKSDKGGKSKKNPKYHIHNSNRKNYKKMNSSKKSTKQPRKTRKNKNTK